MKKREEEEESKDPVWLTTFGDAMSLMLTFFVMLFAATSLNKSKIEPALGSLRGALGIMQKTKPAIVSTPLVVEPTQKIAQQISQFVISKGLTGKVKVKLVRGGIRVSLASPILFELGKAELKPAIFPLLDKIAIILKKLPNEIVVEGHTDNLPIHTERFPSNWELSAARAINVVKYLEKKGINKDLLSAVGYGEYHPLFPNDTPDHRLRNRRVEIKIAIP